MSKKNLKFLEFQPSEDLIQYADLILKQIQDATNFDLPIKAEVAKKSSGSFDCHCKVDTPKPITIVTSAKDPRAALDLLDVKLRKELSGYLKFRDFESQ